MTPPPVRAPDATVNGGRLTLLVFGEIKPYKGIDVLLRALARLPQDMAARWQLVIAGRPRCELAPLRELAQRARIPVTWRLGFVPDAELAALVASADAVVFPYRRVDASGALMLTLPFGVPVIATRVGVFREMLVDGASAVLAAPDDELSLASALARALGDDALRDRLRTNLRRQVDTLWSWEAIARAHLAAYRRHRSTRARAAGSRAFYSRQPPTPAAVTVEP